MCWTQGRDRYPEVVVTIRLAGVCCCVDEPAVSCGNGRFTSAPTIGSASLIDQLVPGEAEDPWPERDTSSIEIAHLGPRLLEGDRDDVVGHCGGATAAFDEPDEVGCMAAKEHGERRVIPGAGRGNQDPVVPVAAATFAVRPPSHSASSVRLTRRRTAIRFTAAAASAAVVSIHGLPLVVVDRPNRIARADVIGRNRGHGCARR